jgi:ABC-type multidrug transport system ATPase subunit
MDAPSEPRPAALLAARGLVAGRDGREVLRGVDLDVPAGIVTGLLGPSGSGKTTLLRCLVRLEEPSAGRVLLDGADVRGLDARELRRTVGFVAQSPAMLPGTVADNLRYGMTASGAEDPSPQLEALAACALGPEFLDRDARRLSGGEAARVAIARALARRPRALLLDEPTAGLDARAAAHVEATVATLAARGLAVLLVSHDAGQHARLARATVELG